LKFDIRTLKFGSFDDSQNIGNANIKGFTVCVNVHCSQLAIAACCWQSAAAC